MLETDPETRPCAAECLTHDFFIEHSKANPSYNEMPEESITDNLKNFQEK
jgi:hypothetical protein